MRVIRLDSGSSQVRFRQLGHCRYDLSRIKKPELGWTPADNCVQSPEMSVVRISRASYPPSSHDEVAARLDASKASLIPAIEKLDGMISYCAGADPASNTMVNVSVWATLDAANQMATLPEMLALAGEFIELGVEFERPIVNYESLWEM